MKKIIISFSVIILLLTSLVLFRNKQTDYFCRGTVIEEENIESPINLYITLLEKRWFSFEKIKTDSDGTILMEIPMVVHERYRSLKRIGYIYHIGPGIRGSFSKLSGRFVINTDFHGFIEVDCVKK